METTELVEYLKTLPLNLIREAVNDLPEHVAQVILNDITSATGGQAATYPTPGALSQAIDPKMVITPALAYLNQVLVRAIDTPGSRTAITFAPQEGKSTTVSVWLPIWCLMRDPDMKIIIACATSTLAEGFSMQVRDIIKTNPQLGLTIDRNLDRQNEWKLAGRRGGIYATSTTATINGKPADLLIIDDPNKDYDEARSETTSSKVWRFWTGSAVPRLSAKAPAIVLQTRWHENDLIGRLLRDAPDIWDYVRIPAQADHRPELGETDPLGREPGEYMVSARGRTTAQWEQRKREVGPKMFAAQFQGQPSPDEGGIFPGTWARYDKPLYIQHPDGTRTIPGIGRTDYELIQSWDLAFKDTHSSDYVVGQIWLRIGPQAYLIDMIRDRLNFNDTLNAIKKLSARYPQAIAKYVEDKANGPAVINALTGTLPGLIPINPEGSKESRAHAISPLAHSGDIILPEPHLLPSVEELLEELKLFPNTTHDDTVDALTQATNQLLLNRIDTNNETHQLLDTYEVSPY